jgi:predicted MPP superfamily phosphohydrolase
MMFAAFLMLVFGPYLLVVGLCDGRGGGVYALNEKTSFAVSRGLARESTPLPRFFNHPEIMVVGLLANGAAPVHTR